MRAAASVALLIGLSLAATTAGADRETPEEAIKTVLNDQVKAWNKGDLEGFMRGYWKSPKLTFSSGGDETHGWDATLERYRKKYKDKGAEMGQLAFADIRIEMLGDGHALVRGRFELERGKEKNKGLFTLVVKKFADGWRIIHDHTS